jgi:hypothetical protein
VPFRTQGYFINFIRGATKLSNITKRVIICIIKLVSTLEKTVVVCRGVELTYKMGSIPTYPTDCSLTYYEFTKTGVRLSQLHKSDRVFVDGVASRYTNS